MKNIIPYLIIFILAILVSTVPLNPLQTNKNICFPIKTNTAKDFGTFQRFIDIINIPFLKPFHSEDNKILNNIPKIECITLAKALQDLKETNASVPESLTTMPSIEKQLTHIEPNTDNSKVTFEIIQPKIKNNQTITIKPNQSETSQEGLEFSYVNIYLQTLVNGGSGKYKINASFHSLDGKSNDYGLVSSDYIAESSRNLQYSLEPGLWEIKLFAEDSNQITSETITLNINVLTGK